MTDDEKLYVLEIPHQIDPKCYELDDRAIRDIEEKANRGDGLGLSETYTRQDLVDAIDTFLERDNHCVLIFDAERLARYYADALAGTAVRHKATEQRTAIRKCARYCDELAQALFARMPEEFIDMAAPRGAVAWRKPQAGKWIMSDEADALTRNSTHQKDELIWLADCEPGDDADGTAEEPPQWEPAYNAAFTMFSLVRPVQPWQGDETRKLEAKYDKSGKAELFHTRFKAQRRANELNNTGANHD